MYTRGGDKGQTGLYGPKRVAKDSPRVEAYGTVDELNSCIGVAISSSGRKEVSEELRWVQGRLLVAGADLASELAAKGRQDRVPRIGVKDTKSLEAMIDRMQTKLPRLTSFILPGGTAQSAQPPPRPVGLQEGREGRRLASRRRRRSTRNSYRFSTGSPRTCSTRRGTANALEGVRTRSGRRTRPYRCPRSRSSRASPR